MNAIEVRGLNVRRDHFEMNNVSMEVPKGCVVGLVGRNGAGKTTLIEAIAGVTETGSGTITYDGMSIWENEKQIKQDLGVVFAEPWFNNMTSPRVLVESIYPWYPDFDFKYFVDNMQRMEIDANMTINQYSSGMLRKFLMIFVLARRPKTLILDEPTTGVDPVSRNEMLDLLYEFMQQEDHSILFSTHITSDLDKIADYIVMLEKGRVIMNESKEMLQSRYQYSGRGLPDIETIMLDIIGEGTLPNKGGR